MKKSALNARMNLTLSDADFQFLDELAVGIGCSRSAVAAHLLGNSIIELRALAPRVRARCLAESKRLRLAAPERVKEYPHANGFINSQIVVESERVLRGRGPSLRFIHDVIDGLLSLARSTQTELSL
jgi:hypothetical protein